MTQNRWLLICLCSVPVLSAEVLTTGVLVERDGVPRLATLVDQGIPVRPLTQEQAGALRLERADGKPLAAFIEPEGRDEKGRIVWVRASALVSLPARGRLPVRLVLDGSPRAAVPRLRITDTAASVRVEAAGYELLIRRPGEIELLSSGQRLLNGPWKVALVGDARAILWGSFFRPFEAAGVRVEQHSPHAATLILSGYLGKNQRKAPARPEAGSRVECELRLYVNALSPEIRFDWRITNLTGSKLWLQRYALELPLPAPGVWKSFAPDRGMVVAGSSGRISVTADFIEDLGTGAGMRLTNDRNGLLHGGLDMPPDGGFYSGAVPDIHRLFHHGMSRTFSGALIPHGTAAAALEARKPVDLLLPSQYYSTTGALPEKGDPVNFGGYADAITKAAEWLLKTQWRGTLYWGEWYREWDETRNMGVQEASNGHSPLAPLYHYWRTGDARFLACAKRSAAYVWDVQLFKGEEGQGRMFHTRRHLFDELDWIHPRYQRATGGLLSSHVFLDSRARSEIIGTIRSFHEHHFDENGAPHDWDKAANKRGAAEGGVDTSNFMEALAVCYRETGDRRFLDWGLKMARWTGERWKSAGHKAGDDWNWNLTNYVLRGLVALYEISNDSYVSDLAIDVCRTTLENSSTDGMNLKNGVGGGELHFVFYHAWISTRVAKIAPDGRALMAKLLPVVERELARQRPDGLFTLDRGNEAGMPTRWVSYYEAKSLVAYVPVITAHLAAAGK